MSTPNVVQSYTNGHTVYACAATRWGMVDADDLLKLVLVLVLIWIGLEVLDAILDITLAVFDFLSPVIGLVLVVLIVLFLLDRI